MIHVSLSFTMSVRVLVCLIFCVGEPTGSNEKVTQIAPGSDVSLSCSCNTGQACWEGPKISNTMRVNFKGIEYLLIKDFQYQNKGQYDCRSKTNQQKQISPILDLKYASSNDYSILFRASEGDSLFLFCKDLISSSISATWSWKALGSGQDIILQPGSAGKWRHIRNKDNDFSLNMSNIGWGDSGRYVCRRFKDLTEAKTSFELVVVKVHADPQQLTEGDDITLHCNVSHHLPNIRLYWINVETQENFPNPHQLRNIMMGQRNWMCAVFNGSILKALFPLTLNISQHLTTTTARSSTPTTHYHTSDESKTLIQTTRNNRWTTSEADSEGTSHPRKNLILITTGFSFILVVALAVVCWRRTKKNSEAEHPTLCVRDSVTYAEVSFRQKSERRKKVEEDAPSYERDSVTYAEVSFRQKSDGVSL